MDKEKKYARKEKYKKGEEGKEKVGGDYRGEVKENMEKKAG